VNAESLLLEAAKQVKVSDLEDDILELPEDDPAAANNQSVAAQNRCDRRRTAGPVVDATSRVTARSAFCVPQG